MYNNLKAFTQGGDCLNIYDIAQKANVSIATVSRVLNNSEKVSVKTRKKVLEIIKKEDYVPNAFARGLGLDTMQMVGVMCTDVTDMFYANAVACIEKFFRMHNINIVLCNTGNKIEDKRKYLSYLVNRKVDAVVLIGSAFKEETDNSHLKEAAHDIPLFIINGYVDAPNIYCIVCDERSAVRDNVFRLKEQGYNDILYIYDASTYSGNEKLCGYLEGCAKYSCNPSEKLSMRVDGKSIKSSYNGVLELYNSGIHFDSVIASEDILAAGALKAIGELDLKIPVIGFNNSIIANCTTPTLSSVDNMVESMCESVVNLYISIKEGKDAPAKTVVSSRFIERESFKLKEEH